MSTTCSASRRASYLVLRMHVVVASHQPLPAKGYGGPQRVVVALVRGLAALGHRITLLAPPTTRVPEATVVAVPPRKLADPATLAPYVPRDAAIDHTHFTALRSRLLPLRPDRPPQPEARRSLVYQQHLSLARSCASSQQRRLRLQRARSRGLRLLAFSQAPVAVRSVPRGAAQCQWLSLGGGSREADRPPPDCRGRLAAQLHGIDQVRG